MRVPPSCFCFAAILLATLATVEPVHCQQLYRAILLSEPKYPPPAVTGMKFGQVFGAFQFPDAPSSAAVWDVNSGTATNPHPAVLYSSETIGVNGSGWIIAGDSLGQPRKHLYIDSSGMPVDFTPTGEYDKSVVTGAYLDTQFGWVRSTPSNPRPENPYGVSNAALWKGTPGSFVNLHDRARLHSSWVTAVSDQSQAGIGTIGNGSIEHALMWRGSSRTLIDLHPLSPLGSAYPPPFESTQAWAVDWTAVVGMAMFKPASEQAVPHAILWNGSHSNYVDLHPDGFSRSYARGVNGKTQVGYGSTGKFAHAIVWNGSPESAQDLHRFIPNRIPALDFSVAFAIDEFGNIAGIAGYFENPGASQKEVESVVVWTPTIEGIAPKLAVAPTIKTGGWILLQLSGIEGKTYQIESSLDLVF